jgi:glycosyltransferase involved in cell wall biosynthesis
LEGAIREGISPYVLSWTSDPVVEFARASGLPVTVSSAAIADLRRPLGAIATATLIRKIEPDLVYTYYLPPVRGFIRASAAVAQVPIVAHQFGELLWSPRMPVAALQRYLDRTSSRWRGATIAPSVAVFAQLKALGVRSSQLRLIPYGVDVEAIASADEPPRADINAFMTRFESTIAVLGRLDANKNQLASLRVFADAAPRDCCLLLIGGEVESGYASRLRHEAEVLGVGDRTLFVGEMDRRDAWAVLRHVDVLLHLSGREGFGIAPLEAQAVGVPVVASAAGGLNDVVADGKSGYLVPSGDLASAEQRLGMLLRDDEARASMSRYAEEWVRDRFDLAASLRATFSLFDELAS